MVLNTIESSIRSSIVKFEKTCSTDTSLFWYRHLNIFRILFHKLKLCVEYVGVEPTRMYSAATRQDNLLPQCAHTVQRLAILLAVHYILVYHLFIHTPYCGHNGIQTHTSRTPSLQFSSQLKYVPDFIVASVGFEPLRVSIATL